MTDAEEIREENREERVQEEAEVSGEDQEKGLQLVFPPLPISTWKIPAEVPPEQIGTGVNAKVQSFLFNLLFIISFLLSFFFFFLFSSLSPTPFHFLCLLGIFRMQQARNRRLDRTSAGHAATNSDFS